MCAMVHREGVEEEEGADEALEREELLYRHLLHRCHLSLHVEGLRTGYSRDVHGEVRVGGVWLQ